MYGGKRPQDRKGIAFETTKRRTSLAYIPSAVTLPANRATKERRRQSRDLRVGLGTMLRLLAAA
jgi:hypothetical protein